MTAGKNNDMSIVNKRLEREEHILCSNHNNSNRSCEHYERNRYDIGFEIKKVYINEENYPELLRQIKDPPDPLYYTGDLALTQRPCVAVVGSRRTTEYGRWAASALGGSIAAAGGVVVSGMAAGIDTCAHWGAIKEITNTGSANQLHIDKHNGANLPGIDKPSNASLSNIVPPPVPAPAPSLPTIAVLGCGIDICFPKSNRKLMDTIAAGGLILSEYPPGTAPTKYTFPRRNRIISGLSLATVVVQAPNTSGALITANAAAEQGRDVYAIPGNINSAYNFGSNKLLRDGAIPLVVLDDLLDDLGLSQKKHITIEENFGEDEKVILRQLADGGEMTVDQLCTATGKPPAEVGGIVTILEMKGVVCSCLGKIFIAK